LWPASMGVYCPKKIMIDKNSYIITGGTPIIGKIKCLGAKNFATKAMIAAAMAETSTTLLNVPNIGDVQITVELLESIGATIDWNKEEETMLINPTSINGSIIEQAYSGSNRMPVLLLGAMLHRNSEVRVPMLGGCTIGARKVNFHLEAITQFGGIVKDDETGFVASKTSRLEGTHFELQYPSVGATETCLYLSVLAKGTSTISNIAIEPEIIQLMSMLRSMGAIIYTTGERSVRIEGVEKLNGTNISVIGDRIETASWACLAAATDGEITVVGIRPETMGNFLASFIEVGGEFLINKDESITFKRSKNGLKPIHIETNVYPGFSTDWQQPFSILLTQTQGTSVIHETVYENRFGYTKALKILGANVQVVSHCLGKQYCRFSDKNHLHSAIINGKTKLINPESIKLTIPDLRAGLAYVIAAAVAEGTTELEGVRMIERGYGNIVPRLQKLGLKIEKK
jgi:UDP-N-acetylglucosamine 1-carboxyvinyltransferase